MQSHCGWPNMTRAKPLRQRRSHLRTGYAELSTSTVSKVPLYRRCHARRPRRQLPTPTEEPKLIRSRTLKVFRMIAPLDPVIAEIIPLLPLRDPQVMTPQSCREALRALAASRADVPPPAVGIVEDVSVKGAAGPLPARVYRASRAKSPTVVFFHGGGWVAGDLETHDRQA